MHEKVTYISLNSYGDSDRVIWQCIGTWKQVGASWLIVRASRCRSQVESVVQAWAVIVVNYVYMYSCHDVPGDWWPPTTSESAVRVLLQCDDCTGNGNVISAFIFESAKIELCKVVDSRNMHICAEKKNWTHVFAITSCLRPMYQRIWCVPHSTLRELSFCIRHWLSKYILLILQIKTSLQAERKRNGKTYHARLQVALHTQIGSDCRCQQGFDEERHLGIVLKWIHIPCEILVKWNRIFKIKYHYAPCQQRRSQEEKSKTRRARERRRRDNTACLFAYICSSISGNSYTIALNEL